MERIEKVWNLLDVNLAHLNAAFHFVAAAGVGTESLEEAMFRKANMINYGEWEAFCAASSKEDKLRIIGRVYGRLLDDYSI